MKRIIYNHVLRVAALTISLLAAAGVHSQTLLFDFGGSDAPTAPPAIFWNNLTPEQGSMVFGVIDVNDTDGNSTGLQLFVDAVFNAAPNTSGTTGSSVFPSSATGDSLIGTGASPIVTLYNETPPADTFTFTFFASDTTATGNRTTSYMVDGSTSTTVDLEAVGNIDNTVSVADVGFKDSGEITTTLLAGPGNSSGTVHLGVLQIDSSAGWTAIVDFGADDAQTTVVGGGPLVRWNNVGGTVASSDAGILENIVSTEGSASTLGIQMVSRFNGVNTSGTSDSGIFPTTATQDSFFGNTEEFSSLSDITPIFRMTGLDTGTAYDFTFYASRLGVGDNRETVYSLTGATTENTSLDPGNNVSEVATVTGIMPDASGEILIELTPGPNNNNGNHFIYLGVMQIDEASPAGASYLFDWGGDATTEVEVSSEIEDSWNNVTGEIGTSDTGTLSRLLTSDGARTDSNLEMIARFNGVNTSGSAESTVFPTSATRDSLFGNTESFGGLENVLPSFKLTGLDPASVYDFVFYGSRGGVSDVRETRFTLIGARTSTGDLDASNNVDNTTTVSGVVPNATGEVIVEITPGPNNNNGSHFTYLGAMQVDRNRAFVPRILVDAGGTNFPTDASSDPENVWNNFQGAVGQTDDGTLEGLVTADGTTTPIGIQMLARFNGVNEAGTQEAAPYPVTATQDSLFGNTEDWSGLTDIFPAFELTGLTPGTAYDLTFYGSRDASDNRETQYTVTGSNSAEVALNVAGNINQIAVASAIMPTTEGTITVNIGPGPNNNNANHFTYLGALRIDWVGGPPPTGDVVLSDVGVNGDMFSFTVTGDAGQTCSIEGTTAFGGWAEVQSVQLSGGSAVVEIAIDGAMRFFRAVKQVSTPGIQ